MNAMKRILSVLVSLTMLLAVLGSGTAALAAETTRFPAVYTADLVRPEKDDAKVEVKVQALVKNMTDKEKWSFIHGTGMGDNGAAGILPGVPRYGVPQVRMHDGPGGLFYLTPSTNPPQEEMLAATWDETLAEQYGSIYSTEAKAMGAGMMLSAQVDIQRMPQFSRTKDQMGEDPYLLSHLSDDLVRGMQSEGGIAVLKHYVGYTDGMENDIISEQALHETYLPGFETAVKNADALGVMSSYNSVNGEATANSSYLQNEILRNQWKYRYFTITDWLMGNHGYSMDKGTDIEMPYGFFNNQALGTVKAGSNLSKLVDQAVTRVLRSYGKAGYLSLVKIGPDGKPREEKGRTDPIRAIPVEQAEPALEKLAKRNSDIAQTVAENGAVLLKNDNGALPLREGESVGVVGYSGMNPISGIGGERSYGTVSEMSSTYSELVRILGKDQVSGTPYQDKTGVTIPNAALYTDKTGSQHGLKRTYGVNSLHKSFISAESMQGAGAVFDTLKPVTDVVLKVKQTGMPGHSYGESAGIDPALSFTTGLRNGKPNGTYRVSRADPGTANAFPASGKPAYTWDGYLEAPETGTYTISYQSIGGLAEMKLYDTDDSTVLAEINATAGTRQSAQWQDGITVTPTGMNIVSKEVPLQAGKRYHIHAEAMYSTPDKDLQVGLSWVTPSQHQKNATDAVRIARIADKVLIFAYAGAPNSPMFGKGSREDLTLKLPAEQESMINEVAAAAHRAGKKAIVVLNATTAVVMRNWVDNVDAVLFMYYPGQRGGAATANLLTGKVNPSGKLAFTIPKSDDDTVITYGSTYDRYHDGTLLSSKNYYDEGINIGYKWYDSQGITPEFDFGHGLSYTTFQYSDLKVKSHPAKGEHIGFDVTFKVKNTGTVTGSETTELYLGAAQVPNGIQTSKLTLAGFAKIHDLKPGKTETVKLHLGERELSYWNPNATAFTQRADGTLDKWTVATGPRTVYVGPSSDHLVLKETVTVGK